MMGGTIMETFRSWQPSHREIIVSLFHCQNCPFPPPKGMISTNLQDRTCICEVRYCEVLYKTVSKFENFKENSFILIN